MEGFIRGMNALTEVSRVKIVKMLQCRSMCVCELQEALGIAQSSVSKHLEIQEDVLTSGGATYPRTWETFDTGWKSITRSASLPQAGRLIIF